MHRVSNLFMRQSYWKYFFPKPSVQDLTPHRSLAHHVLAYILFPWHHRFFMRHHIAQHAPQWVTKTSEGWSTGGARNQSNSDTEWALLLFYKNGGGCPRTTDHKSEILQSVSSSDDSCLSYGNNYQLLGDNTSNPSSATYNLKVENSQNWVLGRPGGRE